MRNAAARLLLLLHTPSVSLSILLPSPPRAVCARRSWTLIFLCAIHPLPRSFLFCSHARCPLFARLLPLFPCVCAVDRSLSAVRWPPLRQELFSMTGTQRTQRKRIKKATKKIH